MSCASHSAPSPLGPSSPRLLCSLSASPCCAPPGQPTRSPWTPWSECSASCGPARRHRHRFCTRPPGVTPSSLALLPPLASAPPLCPGPEAEEEPCLLLGCDHESRGAQMWPLRPVDAFRLAPAKPSPLLCGRPPEPDPTPGPGGLLRGASDPGGRLPGSAMPRYLPATATGLGQGAEAGKLQGA